MRHEKTKKRKETFDIAIPKFFY